MSRSPQKRFDRIVWSAALTYLLVLVGCEASAAPPAPTDAARFSAECGSCHLAYPPRLLPASGWQAVMDSLDRHFGVDASLDPASAAAIRRHLLAGAAPRAHGSPGEDPRRISATAWFRGEHREVPAASWRTPAVRSPSNCEACHRQAAQARFDEDSVQLPR
ncbi:MAG: diheme cytochrome c [Proteobacteria bacterium]|nr:diheme cytochrome c [Pseudomonadota bacterium]